MDSTIVNREKLQSSFLNENNNLGFCLIRWVAIKGARMQVQEVLEAGEATNDFDYKIEWR